MLRTIVTTVAVIVALVFTAGLAVAGEVQGTVKAVDATERTVLLEDGTKLWLSEGISVDAFKEGTQVVVSYEARDGKNVATSVETK